MAIRLYTGIPGSGKTYRVVYDIVIGDLLKKYYIIHNIPNLRVAADNIKSYNPENDQLGININELFSYAKQKELSEKIKAKYGLAMLMIIDECDKMGMDKVSPIHKEWLSMHRHIGQDIYLITQSRYNIAKDYVNLIEVEIQGKRGFVFNAFIYSWYASGEKISTDRLPKVRHVFESYRSFHIAEMKKPKARIWKILIVVAVIGVVSITYFMVYGVPQSFDNVSEQVNKDNMILDKKEKEKDIVNKINEIKEKNEKKVYYGGVIKDKKVFVDMYGNMYDENSIISEKDVLWKNNNKRMITYINTDEGLREFKTTYIESKNKSDNKALAARREAASDTEQIRKRKYWVEVR